MSTATPPAAPRPEAVAAATWWAQKLGTPTHQDIGDPTATAMMQMATVIGANAYSEQEIEAFRTAATEAIEQHLAKYSWPVDDPEFGSYLRTIANDYGPDPVLRQAAVAADICLSMFDLPTKTVMWINPGTVRVAEGYNADITTIWQQEA